MAAIALSTLTASAQKVEIFGNTQINAAGKHQNFTPDSAGVLYTQSGRIIFKKVNFPTFKNTTKATINMTVASAGDRWDKSGSCFIIPNEAANSIMKVLKGESELPVGVDAAGGLRGVMVQNEYSPTLELLRFMTPFGVGHYSDDQLKRKPVYIPFWEKQVSWSEDISQLISRLQGEVYVGVWIDSWTPEGYVVSADVTFDESELSCDKIRKSHVLPVLNTVPYIGGQGTPDVFSRQDIDVSVNIPKGAKNVRLYYITTGHGGHSGGDEFTKQRNVVFADGDAVIDFVPWRDDCASFRRFNPGSGVWIRKRIAPYIGKNGYEEKEIEESLASSDLSRSNWCPGSCIVPEMVMLPSFTEGNHRLTFSIPNAQKAVGDALNHWLVSAYLVWDTK